MTELSTIEPMVTAREIADVLGVNPETVLRWVRRGELRAYRLPSGQLRFRASEVEDWVASRHTRGHDLLARHQRRSN